MANFRTHITSSVLLGTAYGVAGHLGYEMSIPSACVAGGLVSIGGILPDVDSDNAIVLRESLAFLAAIAPMLMLQRFYEWGWTNEMIVFVAGVAYIAIRFGIGTLLRKLTVHRGMWHSIPAALIAGGVIYLVCTSPEPATRWFKTGAMLLGYFWHLLLDELNSLESTSTGRVRIKRSFGTALKFFGRNPLANVGTYAILVLVAGSVNYKPTYAERAATFVDSIRRQHAGEDRSADEHPPTKPVESHHNSRPPAPWPPY